MNIFRDSDWIFNCPVTFPSRFDGSDNYFKPKDDVAPDQLRGLAMRRTNLVPDIFNAELYLDNRRSPGYRRLEPALAGNVFYQFVGEHIPGRYSLHDLLRAYATELVQAEEAEETRDLALVRLIDHYARTAENVAMLIRPHRTPFHDAPPAQPDVRPRSLADSRQAATWLPPRRRLASI